MQEIKGFEPGPYKVIPDLASLRGPGCMIVARFDCMGEHKRILCTNTGGPTAQLFAAAPSLYAECQKLTRQRDALREALEAVVKDCVLAKDSCDTFHKALNWLSAIRQEAERGLSTYGLPEKAQAALDSLEKPDE